MVSSYVSFCTLVSLFGCYTLITVSVTCGTVNVHHIGKLLCSNSLVISQCIMTWF